MFTPNGSKSIPIFQINFTLIVLWCKLLVKLKYLSANNFSWTFSRILRILPAMKLLCCQGIVINDEFHDLLHDVQSLRPLTVHHGALMSKRGLHDSTLSSKSVNSRELQFSMMQKEGASALKTVLHKEKPSITWILEYLIFVRVHVTGDIVNCESCLINAH